MMMRRYLLLLLPLLLAACGGSSVRDTLGLSRKAPDEFRVVSRPPLSVPPEFSLRPPAAPGEVAPGSAQVSPRDQAQSLVLGKSDSAAALSSGTADTAVQPVTINELESAADSQFLNRAGAEKADSAIRQQLTQEQAAKQDEDKSLLQRLREPSNNEPLVNAKQESERIKENQEAGKPITDGDTPTVKSRDTGTLGKIFGY